MTSIIKRTLDMIQAPIKRRQAIRIEKQKNLISYLVNKTRLIFCLMQD